MSCINNDNIDNEIQMRNRMENILSRVKDKNICEIIHMLNPEIIETSYENKYTVTRFKVEKWTINPIGSFHGGLITTCFDSSFGTLSHYLGGDQNVTTVNISTTFLKPFMLNDVFTIKSRAVSVGKTMITITGEAYNETRGVIGATATATFMVLKKLPSKI